MYEGSAAAFHSLPLSDEVSTWERVAATIRFPLDCTETKSLFPITGPPLQLLPWLVLLNNPAEVAANQVLEEVSTSLTRASRVDLVAVLLSTRTFFLPFSTVRKVLFSMTTELIAAQSPPLRASKKIPLLVPAIRSPFAACCRVSTSRPPSPALFCCQLWPPSCEANTPPNSRSFTTPTKTVLG